MYREKRDFKRPGGGGNYRGGPRRQQQPRRHNPLPEGFSLFYIAIVCPEQVEEKLSQFKGHMENRYGCRAAKKSPAHLTIVPPFRAETEMEQPLLDFVQTFNMGMVPFDVELKGYGHFGDRVLFVDVPANESLNGLEKEAMQEFSNQFPSIIFGMKPDFNPHVTIATRDIPEGKLQEALDYFEANHPVEEKFTAKEMKLMRLVDGWWKLSQ